MGFFDLFRPKIIETSKIPIHAQSSRDAISRDLGNYTPRRKQAVGAGSMISGGYLDDDDNNTAVQGSKWYGEPGAMGIARQMENDAHVKQSLIVKRAPLQSAIWDFKPATKEPIDIEIADYCKYNFFKLINWERTIRFSTLYMRDGFSLLEFTDDNRPIPEKRFPLHPGRGTGLVLTDVFQMPSWTLSGWVQSKKDPTKLYGVKQWIQGSDGEKAKYDKFISSKKLLRFTQDQEGANFAGNSYLRSAYGPWKIKLMLLVLDAIRHERQGVGIPTITLPEQTGEDDYELAQRIMLEMRAHEKGYLALPFGFVFDWSTVSASDGTAIGKAIERCNRDIIHNMGAVFMDLGSSASASRALAETLKTQYEMQLEADARFISTTFNIGSDGWSPIKRLVDANYGEGCNYPLLVARNMPTRDWSKVFPVIHNLTTSGHVTPDEPLEEFIREVHYLPPRDPTTARETNGGKEIKQDRNPPQEETDED